MYQKNLENIISDLETNKSIGLSNSEVKKRLEKDGKNEFTKKKKQSLFVKFLLQFKDVLIIILMLAAIISFIVEPNEWIESVIIFVVIFVNAILGVFQENKAEKSLEALEKMSSPLCKVLREGVMVQENSSNLVVGDIIVVEAGDFIPADARIINCSNLKVDESALTGESVPVDKHNNEIIENQLPIGDQKNMLFSSTFVTNGRAEAVVIATGMNTEIGRIAGMLLVDHKEVTPLQHKLSQVGKVIGILSIIICIIVFVLEYFSTKNSLYSFKTAIALAVAAIPEGLATVVTIVLAIGVNNMAKVNAIVKKLPAVETLGCTSIICSDKTGTLTQNKMTVVEVYRDIIKKTNQLTDEDKQMIQYFALCSDAEINVVDGVEKRIGDPTETALIELNNLYGLDINNIKRLGDVPFDSIRKMMTVICLIDNKIVAITKGAPDIIIKNSLHNSKTKTNLEYALQVNNNMAVRALRVLGMGYKVYDKLPDRIDESIEKDLNFLGLVGMVDPSRPEVKDSIEIAKKAGLKTIMITGDHVVTAQAIAKDLGILTENTKAISSSELANLSDDELYEHIEEYVVYARVSPEDKVRVVNAWQRKNKVVAMTGDGVNDAPVLKKADIGCAMGITGTDVAKETADMILVDDNFATIITAIKEGRGIYANIKKCVKYLLSSNIGEVLTIFIASILALIIGNKIGVPLSPIHLLWINLITDSLPAFGLGMERATNDLMNEPPRDKNETFFANKLGIHIALEGIIIGALTLSAYLIGLKISDATTAQTMAFFTLATCQLLHAFNVKTDGTLFSKETFNNRFLNLSFIVGFLLQLIVIYIPGLNTIIFKVNPLNFECFAICMGLSLIIIIVMEIAKLLGYRKKK